MAGTNIQLEHMAVMALTSAPPYQTHSLGYTGADNMVFEDVFFPQCISYGSTASPLYSVDKTEVPSGQEQRNARNEFPRHVYRIILENLYANEISEIVRIYHVCSGGLNSFMFLDPLDHTSHDKVGGYYSDDEISNLDQSVGVANGAAVSWALYKVYTHEARTKRRRIRHPKTDTLIVSVNGVASDQFTWNAGTQKLDWTAKAGAITYPTVTFDHTTGVISGLDATATFSVGDLIYTDGFGVSTNNGTLSTKPLRITAIDATTVTVARFDSVAPFLAEGGSFDIDIAHVSVLPSGAIIKAGYEFYTPVRFDEGAMEIDPKAGLRESLVASLDSVVLREVLE